MTTTPAEGATTDRNGVDLTSPAPVAADGATAPGEHGLGFEGGEHTYLGDHVTLRFDDGSGAAGKLRLDNGLALTYGQIVALAGDFYGGKKPISDDPLQFAVAYRNLAVEAPAATEALKILDIMEIEIEAVRVAIDAGQQPSTAYLKLGDDLSGRWNRLTGGGSVVTDFFPYGRYLKLANVNWDHFGLHAIACYKIGHAAAEKAAVAAAGASGPQAKATLLEGAYAMNAFADHFLTDLFSAGHLRTPRKSLYDTVTPSWVAGLLAKFMHDEDSAFGLQVTNARGDSWRAYGDKRLRDTVDAANLSMVMTAIQASADDVWNAYKNGVTGTATALEYVPKLDALVRTDTANISPLFVKDGGTVLRRTEPRSRRDYTWTNLWAGWSTLVLLRVLPSFRPYVHEEIPLVRNTTIAHLWSQDGTTPTMAMALYGLKEDGSFGTLWESGTLEAMRTGPFLGVDVDGDGRTSIACVDTSRPNPGLFIDLYMPMPHGGYYLSATTPTGALPSNAGFLTYRGPDAKTRIVQLLDDGKTFGMIVYHPTVDRVYGPESINVNLGPHRSAVATFAADVDGDGDIEIVQLYDNSGRLGMYLYAQSMAGGFTERWSSPDLGAEVAGTYVPVAGADGRTRIVQIMRNENPEEKKVWAAVNVFAPDEIGYGLAWQSRGIGELSEEATWLAVDFEGNGRTHLAQLGDRAGRLTVDVYEPTADGGYGRRWLTPDIGTSTNTVGWFTTDSAAGGGTVLMQLRDDNGFLTLSTYRPDPATHGYVKAGDVATTAKAQKNQHFLTVNPTTTA